MKTLLRLGLPLVCLLASGLCRAQQPSAFRAVRQEMAILPDSAASLFVFDDILYCHSSGVLLRATRSGHQITGFVPDTNWVKLDAGIEYAVRQPGTGDLYYTSRDRKGRSTLYVCREENGKRSRAKQVVLDDLEVFHPTFSRDGRIMVFSSTGRKNGRGDYDLWYVRLSKDKWGDPHNVGSRVNTRADETAPVIVDDFLFFSSGGHDAADGGIRLCATPLMAPRTSGDTVGMPQVGYGRIYTLPSPFNATGSAAASIAFDTLANCAYWTLGAVRPASTGTSLLPVYAFHGDLRTLILWGYVRNTAGKVLPNASVTVLHDGSEVCTTLTDNQGFYSLCLPQASSHTVVFRHSGSYADTLRLQAGNKNGAFMEELQHDVTLGGLPLRIQIHFYDLFGPNVSTVLSSHGIATLNPLIRFLRDNPTFRANMTLISDVTDNSEFNALLTGQRIQTLKQYLADSLPSTVKLTFRNGSEGRQSDSSASGTTRLTVVISDK